MRKISDENKESGPKIQLGEYWRIIWRKKYLLLIPLIIPVLVSVVGVGFLVPVYQSSSVIRMEDKMLLSKEVARFVQMEERRRMHDREALEYIKAELKTSGFLDQLIERLGLDKDPKLVRWANVQSRTRFPGLSANELIHRRLRNQLAKNIEADNAGPGMFQMSYFDYDPDVAYIVAEAITNVFIAMQQKKQLKGLQDASDFSDEQLALYREQLEKSEREYDRFKKMMSEKKGEANPVGENNIRYAETLLRQVEINVNDEENTLEKIRNNLVSLFGAVPSSDRIWGDEQFKVFENKMVAQKETELLLQLASKGERSEELTTNSKEIEESRRNLQRYLVNLVQISYAEIFKDYHPLIVEYFYQLTTLESYKQKRKSLIAYIDAFKKRLALTPQLERESAKLEEAVKTNRALYNSFLKAKTSTQITESVQNTDLGVSIEVVEDAAKPLSPVRPNKPKIIIIAVLFGGVLGVGSLVVSEYSDTSFKTVEEVEQKLGLTVLGTIPRSDPSKGWKSADRRKKIIAWTAASIIVIVISLLGFYYYGKSEGKHGLELYRTSQTK